MGKIKIEMPGKPDMWIKEINKVDSTVTFTENEYEAYEREGSFYCNAEVSSLKNPIMYDHEKYPELKYAVAVLSDYD